WAGEGTVAGISVSFVMQTSPCGKILFARKSALVKRFSTKARREYRPGRIRSASPKRAIRPEPHYSRISFQQSTLARRLPDDRLIPESIIGLALPIEALLPMQ